MDPVHLIAPATLPRARSDAPGEIDAFYEGHGTAVAVFLTFAWLPRLLGGIRTRAARDPHPAPAIRPNRPRVVV